MVRFNSNILNISHSLLLTFIFCFANYVHAHQDDKHSLDRFSMSTYLAQCPGDSKTNFLQSCDSTEVNQVTLFEDAVNYAKANNKFIFLVLSSNSCPYCKVLNEKINSESAGFNKLEGSFVYLEININVTSAKDLADKYNLKYNGYTPNVYIYDPITQNLIFEVPAKIISNSSFGEIDDWLKVSTALDKQYISQVNQLGNASLKLLQQPIGFLDGLGEINFVKETSNAKKYINQGIALLHVFHYADALRSFKAAEKEDNDLVFALVGQIFSYLSIDRSLGGLFAAPKVEKLISKLLDKDISPKDKLWAHFALNLYASKGFPLAHIKNIQKLDFLNDVQSSYFELASVFKNEVEVLTLANYLSGFNHELSYIQATQINPNHTGGHHYLVHLYESVRPKPEFAKALVHAKKLASLAPKAAHAVHMHGHILPQYNQYEKAHQQFLAADKIHLDWADKNNVSPEEDWHYIHNLLLMAANAFLNGDNKFAEQSYIKACTLSLSACAELLNFYLATHQIELAKQIYSLNSNNKAFAELTETSVIELTMIEEKSAERFLALISPESDENSLPVEAKIIVDIMRADDSDETAVNKLSEELTEYFHQNLTGQGFDGWSKSAIDMVKTYQFAKSIGQKNLSDQLAITIKEFLPKVSL